MITVADCLTATRGDPAPLEREVLLAHVVGRSRSHLRAYPEHPLSPAQARRYRCWLDRCRRGEPVAYIVGVKEFWSLDLAVGPGVLVPRPETELLVELALTRLPRGAAVLDLGTGSGAVALALAKERPDCEITATDASAAALAVARGNARRLRLPLRLIQGHWLDAIGTRFELIAANPPYVAAGDRHLQALRHEPYHALVAGADGLDALREIVAAAPRHLRPGGWLLLEHGHAQGPAVRALMTAAGLQHIDTANDLAGLARVTSGRSVARNPGGAADER